MAAESKLTSDGEDGALLLEVAFESARKQDTTRPWPMNNNEGGENRNTFRLEYRGPLGISDPDQEPALFQVS